MKLATFTHHEHTRIGVVREESVIDLAAAAPGLPTDMLALLAAGPGALEHANRMTDRAGDRETLPLSEVRLHAPVPMPGKVLAIGLNYLDHVREFGREPPEHQIWFNKQHNAVNGPFDPVNRPAVSDALDYEGELCFVVGRRCKHVPPERAHEVIAGYCAGNDVSVRDWQMRTPTMVMGKSFDTHAPLGPYLITADEIGDPQDLMIRTWVNGELRQECSTAEMAFSCREQIAHLTQAFTLDPGDVIFTGTPKGVGGASDPPRYLTVGDRVRVEVGGVGTIENEIVAERAETVIGP